MHKALTARNRWVYKPTVGAKYVLGGPNAIIVEYPQKDNAVYVKLCVTL